MIDEYKTQDRQVRIYRGNFAIIGLERGTKTTECGRMGELGDFLANLGTD